MKIPHDPRVLTAVAFGACLLVVAPAFLIPGAASLTERLGWAANLAQLLSLFGVALALPQLRVMVDEQRRLSASFSKRPNFSIYFETGERSPARPLTTLNVSPVWQGGEAQSEPITFGLVAQNTGTGTAREVHWNVHIPGPVQLVQSQVPCRNPEPASDHLYEGYMPYVHVGASITGWFTIRVLRSQSGQQFLMNMSITMADADLALQYLTLAVDGSQQLHTSQ